ncbi:MAG TPA: alpha/beta hydrolase [Gemmatimonadaceae bacterium]|jgi:pimeloyl-ACP methyl ester carboxylesterase
MPKKLAGSVTAAALVIGAAVEMGFTKAEEPPAANAPAAKPTIILVHGAFADALGWQRVIPLLVRDGYKVTAVENPLTSLAEDIATTKRLIDAQQGPVVVVGHSYGGTVMSGAATSPNVKALVYIAAFAPDVHEPMGAFLEKYPTPLGAALRTDAAGFNFVDPAMFHSVFAPDVSVEDAQVMAATQKPLNSKVFASSADAAAWKTVPSWYVVSKQDRVVSPDLERMYAKRMKANITELDASHVSFISHPAEIVRVIKQAAEAASK